LFSSNDILDIAGTVTDGEFCTLRTQGETRPLHLWQLIHDAKESVKKMSAKVILEMIKLKVGMHSVCFVSSFSIYSFTGQSKRAMVEVCIYAK